jgi:DNA polymerase theta
MLRRLGTIGGTILFIVPFVSLAEEKGRYLRKIWSDMNIGIKIFHGGEDGGNKLTSDIDVAVCTIEKANIIINNLLEDNNEDQVRMIVIDEVHMLSDSKRGFLLEVLLSKVKYLLKDKIQVVAMSATLPNITDLASWLHASLYTTEYRKNENYY